MKPIVPAPIESYAQKHSTPERSLYKQLATVTRKKTKWPQMQVGALEGTFLKLMVRAVGARRVLEIGTFTGNSALAMAEGLEDGGSVVTLDIDPINTMIAHSFWKKSPAGRRIRLIVGPALESLKKLSGPFDVVFIDADKQNYLKYWNACLPKVRRGGLILVDNVLWSGRVLKPADANDRAIVAFNRRIRSDRRVELVMLTVRDGITMAVKK